MFAQYFIPKIETVSNYRRTESIVDTIVSVCVTFPNLLLSARNSR